MISPPVSATTRDSGVASRKEPGVSTSESRPRAASKRVATGTELMMLSSVGAMADLREAGTLRGRDACSRHHAPLPPPGAGVEGREEPLDSDELMEAQELHE